MRDIVHLLVCVCLCVMCDALESSSYLTLCWWLELVNILSQVTSCKSHCQAYTLSNVLLSFQYTLCPEKNGPLNMSK